MRLFIDECVPKPTRLALRHAGHDLLTVEALDVRGAANGELLGLAKRHRVPLVTVDRGLGDLRRFPAGTHDGMVVLKLLRPGDAEAVHRQLLAALKALSAEQLRGALLIVDRTKYRLRRPA